MPSLDKVYSKNVNLLKENKVVFLPFLIFAALELAGLTIIFLAPRMPLKLVLGPIVRAIWGERFLHYPVNFILIPKLMSIIRLGLTVIAGSFLTGTAALLIKNIHINNPPDLKKIFQEALKKYISFFAIVLLFTMVFYFLDKITSRLLLKYFLSGHAKLLFISAKIWFGPLLFCLNIIFAIIIQSAFVYAIPILAIEQVSLTKAILRSFLLFKRYFLKTVMIIGLPMIIYIPLIILQSDPALLVVRIFPESVLLVAILSLVINSLVIDLWITSAATNFYLALKDEKQA